MNYYEVSMVGNVGMYYDVLTYQYSDSLSIGTIVAVPVGKKTSLGVIVKKVKTPDFDCKEIAKVVVSQPLPLHLTKFHDWLSEYYSTKSGIVWQTILPARVATTPRGFKPPKNLDETLEQDKALAVSKDSRTQKLFKPDLNPVQAKAVQQIRAANSGTILLHGITGSGKTEVYKTIAEDTLNSGKSAIVLVPEISLTAQLVEQFHNRFGGNVVVTHSAMTASERNLVWRQILFSSKPLVIIGPRSALFMPVRNLGLIVIDECHEPSYKQESSPRYSTVNAAAMLSRFTDARVILGSATPSISDYYLAKHLGRPIVELNQLARSDAVKPVTKIVDLTKRDNFTSESKLFTAPLLESMCQALREKRQVLLFHNRRGTAGLAMCENCGWIATCPNCYTPLTLHGDKYQLICHICGHTERPPLKCPECDEAEIKYKGIGTKRIEEEIRKLFPQARVRRFDGDTARGEAVQDVWDELISGETSIIIGTQTIAKGLDLPNLAVVGIVQADAGLALPDFSASERTFQLVAQACGRVGRGNQPTTVVVQSYRPETPAVRFGAAQNYAAFYNEEIKNRQHGHFPPFAHLLKISCAYKTERGATIAIGKLAANIRRDYGDTVKILGPAPAFYERMRGLYRWQIVIRASKRTVLVAIASATPSAKFQVELDPISLI